VCHVIHVIASSLIKYNRGESEQPCFTPLPILRALKWPSPILTYAACPLYRFQINLQSLFLSCCKDVEQFTSLPKNTNHSSHMLSPTIRLHNCVFPTVFIVFLCLFLCLLSTIIVQPLAITFNKRYDIVDFSSLCRFRRSLRNNDFREFLTVQ